MLRITSEYYFHILLLLLNCYNYYRWFTNPGCSLPPLRAPASVSPWRRSIHRKAEPCNRKLSISPEMSLRKWPPQDFSGASRGHQLCLLEPTVGPKILTPGMLTGAGGALNLMLSVEKSVPSKWVREMGTALAIPTYGHFLQANQH